MGVFNDKQILGSAQYDAVTNALGNYDVAGKVTGDGTHLFSTFAPCMVHDIVVTPLDVTLSDPSDDIFLGYVLDYTLDFSSYTTVRTQVADADCPMLWKDAGTPDVPDFSLGVPVFMFDFKGKGSVTGRTGTTTNQFGGNNAAPPVRIPAKALVRLRFGTYGAGSLAAISGLDNLNADVIGMFV
jgi:hypothetical protein